MGTRLLLDTNCIIYYLNGVLSQKAKEKIDTGLLISSNISVISKIELLGWNPPDNIYPEPVEKFVNASIILFLNDEVVQKTIEILR